MPQQPLECGKGNAFLYSRNCKGVSEHMRGHRAVDAGFVGNALQDALYCSWRHADGVMDGKVAVNQWAYPVGEGNDAAL